MVPITEAIKSIEAQHRAVVNLVTYIKSLMDFGAIQISNDELKRQLLDKIREVEKGFRN